MLAIEDAAAAGSIQALRSIAHELENARNPDANRAGAISQWLSELNPIQPTPASVADLTRAAAQAGLRLLDAYHLAWAEHLKADAFVTCDDRILSRADRLKSIIQVRIVDPITFVRELER